MALGVPAAIVTGGLAVVGVAGGVATGYSAIRDYTNGNYASLSYGLGSLTGGAITGGVIGGRVGDSINAPATRGYSISRMLKDGYDPKRGSLWDWLATGPDEQTAAGTLGMAGSVLQFLRSGCR